MATRKQKKASRKNLKTARKYRHAGKPYKSGKVGVPLQKVKTLI